MRFAPSILFCAAAAAQVSVPTAQYDNARTGSNIHETLLTPRRVNAREFGKQFVMEADGDVFAQPLYAPHIDIPGKGVHDVVFVATEHDSVYAFDAAGNPRERLWRTSFLGPAIGPVPAGITRCSFLGPEVGITPTPVIDLASKTIYVLARTRENDRYYQRLHALDIVTGNERPGSPVLIRGSANGSRLFGLVPETIDFNAALENPRAALLLANGTVYIAWGSACDAGPYYGWVMGYDARSLKQTAVFNTAPVAGEAGIWQSDAGIAADSRGDVYVVTGNGKFTASSGGRDYGDSILKLGPSLDVRDYFTPFNQAHLNSHDLDLGSSGPVLLPDQPGSHPHVLVTSGKDGYLYVVDRDRMGRFQTGSNSHAIQVLQEAGEGGYGAPAYWNGHLYSFGWNDFLKDFAVNAGRLSDKPARQGTFKFPPAAATPTVSANGTKDGIVWVFLTKAWNAHDRVGALQAYDAADVSRMLYTSATNPDRDTPGPVTRFAMPMVADGRVYVAQRGGVVVYGVLNLPQSARPAARRR
jgi:hypothetical protein